MVLFVRLWKEVLAIDSVDEILLSFPVMLFIMLYKVGLTFESVDEILKCDHSNIKRLLSSTFLW